MSVGPTSLPGSLAGTALAQSRGTDVDRTQQENDVQARHLQGSQRAENAAGIGQAQEDQEAADRDADGRRPWEIGARRGADSPEGDGSEPTPPAQPPQSRDATGQCGNRLDLSG